MHLVNDNTPDNHDNESSSRLVPRLERRKISINRATLLKDAQHSLSQLGTSKPLLEVSFDGEVGTGKWRYIQVHAYVSFQDLDRHWNFIRH